MADEYDRLYGYWYEPVAKVIARHLDLGPADRLVDIGAGTAGVANQLWKIAS